jgi:hypothetical protein
MTLSRATNAFMSAAEGIDGRRRRMIEKIAEPKATDKITVLEGFDAMRVILETIWQRQGKAPEDIAFVLGGSRWADGSPADPMIWKDWLMAVRIARPL